MFQKLYFFEKVIFPRPQNYNNIKEKSRSTHTKNILLVNSAGLFGGAEMYAICLYKNLLKDGYNPYFLIAKNSALEKNLKEEKISYYAYNKFSIFKKTIQPGLYQAIYKICKENNISIIHCNIHREALAAKKVTKSLPVKVVFTCHIPQTLNPKYLKNLDGFIGVNPDIAKIGQNESLNIKESVFIPPIFDEKKFLNFKPSANKDDFFKKQFNLDFKGLPILCMVSNMPKNINHKNHPLLLKAIAKLIHEKQKLVHVVLVGDGSLRNYLEKISKELKIEDFIHFLGFTNKVSEILYHSDIKILTSKEEGLPIVIFEAALLKKPIIVGTNTPMTTVILHEKTGLLFEYNNIDDIVKQIEKLLDNPKLCKTLGENAYHHVKTNFSTENSIKKIEAFYQKIWQSNC